MKRITSHCPERVQRRRRCIVCLPPHSRVLYIALRAYISYAYIVMMCGKLSPPTVFGFLPVLLAALPYKAGITGLLLAEGPLRFKPGDHLLGGNQLPSFAPVHRISARSGMAGACLARAPDPIPGSFLLLPELLDVAQ